MYDIEPGFYNAYKLEVLENFGGQQVAVTKVHLIGLPTEIIPVNQGTNVPTEGVHREYVAAKHSITYLNITHASSNSTQIQAAGHIDYTFVSKRKARSFSLIVGNDKMTGWDILGSNDAIEWDTLFSIRDQSLVAGDLHTYKFDKVALYQRYRLQPKQYTTGTDAYIQYLQLYR